MLSYPSTIPLSTRTLTHLADLIRAHRARLQSRWRRLNPADQALLLLAHLRNGDTYTRLAGGFRIRVTLGNGDSAVRMRHRRRVDTDPGCWSGSRR